jgi:hypothetical protein
MRRQYDAVRPIEPIFPHPSQSGVEGIVRSFITSVAAVLICAIVSTGCATMRPGAISVAPQTRPFAGLNVGDLVQLQLTNGTRHRFEVKAIEGDAIVSDTGQRYARGEIAQLSRETVNGAKMGSLVGVIVAGSAIVLKVLESIQFFGN